MKNTDPKILKNLMIIVCIIITFIILVQHAFDTYIPQDNVESSYTAEQITHDNNITSESQQATSSEDLVDDEDIPEPVKLPSKFIKKELPELEPISTIELPKEALNENTSEIKTETAYDISYNKAKKYLAESTYDFAIEEFKKAIELTEDSSQQADCLEQIALIYAKTKRYGSAISNAQKAYNKHPSTSRELLLARLYYKTGNTDKSKEKIDNILKKDFMFD